MKSLIVLILAITLFSCTKGKNSSSSSSTKLLIGDGYTHDTMYLNEGSRTIQYRGSLFTYDITTTTPETTATLYGNDSVVNRVFITAYNADSTRVDIIGPPPSVPQNMIVNFEFYGSTYIGS